MTEEKLGPGEAWGAIEEMVTADEAARVSVLSDEAEARGGARGDEAGDDAGEDDEPKPDAEEEDDEAPEELPPREDRGTRPRWVTWAVAAGVAVMAALPLLGIPRVRRAMFRPPVTGAPASPDETTVLRTQALHDCAETLWLECWRKLDAARAVDPAGEDKDEVRAARAAIQKGLAPREP